MWRIWLFDLLGSLDQNQRKGDKDPKLIKQKQEENNNNNCTPCLTSSRTSPSLANS